MGSNCFRNWVEIKKPKSVIAKNTVQAAQSGIFCGLYRTFIDPRWTTLFKKIQ